MTTVLEMIGIVSAVVFATVIAMFLLAPRR